MIKYLSVALLLVGCASPGVDRADENQVIQEFYANVVSIKAVELSSDVATGVLVGAGVGIADEADGNTEDMVAGGIAGALVGGLFTAIFEGSDDAFEYSLYNAERGDFTIVQKEKVEEHTTCVKVRVAGKATISAVEQSLCKT